MGNHGGSRLNTGDSTSPCAHRPRATDRLSGSPGQKCRATTFILSSAPSCPLQLGVSPWGSRGHSQEACWSGQGGLVPVGKWLCRGKRVLTGLLCWQEGKSSESHVALSLGVRSSSGKGDYERMSLPPTYSWTTKSRLQLPKVHAFLWT